MSVDHFNGVERVLACCSFRDWKLHVSKSEDRVYLFASWVGQDNFKPGHVEQQVSRRWLIRPEASASEIVQTAFACVMTAMEHEVREQFLYHDRAVFGPHHNVDALWNISAHMERT